MQNDQKRQENKTPPDKEVLLIIDDDNVLAERLGIAMSRRGFDVQVACSAREGLKKAKEHKPDHAIIDLRLKDGSGLDVIKALRKAVPTCRIIILTAFGNIATAVAAIKAGAVDYLSKPADADSIEKALRHSDKTSLPPPPENPMPADRVRWEHILRIFEQCDNNVSETARRLRMHRRTLQRILAKNAPKDNEDTSFSAQPYKQQTT